MSKSTERDPYLIQRVDERGLNLAARIVDSYDIVLNRVETKKIGDELPI